MFNSSKQILEKFFCPEKLRSGRSVDGKGVTLPSKFALGFGRLLPVRCRLGPRIGRDCMCIRLDGLVAFAHLAVGVFRRACLDRSVDVR